MSLGPKIHNLRSEKKLSLRQLSKASGCSLGFLSQVERDLVSPTISSLRKIADALDVNILHFFDNPTKPQRVVVRKGERIQMKNPSSKVVYEMLRPQFSDSDLEALAVQLEPGASSGKEPHAHIGDEFVIVLSGVLQITVAGDTFVLTDGDSAVYKSNQPHSWKNPSDEPASVIWVNHPPTF